MKIPPLLKSGDSVAVVSPASYANSNAWEMGIEVLKDWGLQVVLGEHALNQHFGFAGTDEYRRNDLQIALNSSEIKAIFSLRGGYGSSRLLDSLNFDAFKLNPKWIVGFSDITALLTHIDTFKIPGIHGPMPNNFCQKGGENALELLKKILFEGKMDIHIPSSSQNILGEVSGKLIGGNLSILSHLLGSPSFENPTGKILVLEEIGERLYHVDRMLVQLKRAGYFENLAGLIVGGFTDCLEASLKIGKTVTELILEHTEDYGFPIAFDFPLGHIPTNLPVIFGTNANLLITSKEVHLVGQL